ncbi:MAG: glycerophosphodiester phosphodiesterase family protein [Pseudomonadota bacterium]
MQRRLTWRRALVLSFGLLALLVAVQFLWRGQPPTQDQRPTTLVLAHRGVHLNYHKGRYDLKTGCEAQHIFPPSHAFLENTLQAIAAAFDAGADVVEIDIRKTADNDLVLFHDFALECRTNGTGLVAERTVAELKALDIGFGYTADAGQSFPFRGRGVGKLPTLREALQAFPERSFLLDHKDWDQASLQILIEQLADVPTEQRSRLWFWSSAALQGRLQSRYPEIKPLFFTRREVKDVFAPFFASFGLIAIPDAYRGRTMAIPVEYVPYLWGWPYRFLNAVHAQGIHLFLMVDSADEAQQYASLPVDGFITDYIERTGPILSARP